MKLGRRSLKINEIHNTDCLAGLRQLPDGSVDCVVTSPPYWGLRDYGGATELIWDSLVRKYGAECEHDFEIEERRLHGGSSNNTIHSAINRGGLKVDWTTRDGFCSKCGAWKGQLGLEPDFNLYVRHMLAIFDEVKRVMKDSGTCWVNMGDTYGGSGCGKNDYRNNNKRSLSNPLLYSDKPNPQVGYEAKSLCGIPQRFMLGMLERGWILRNVIIWHKPNCMPSSARDRFTVDFEYIFFFVKSRKYYFETQFEPISASSWKDPRLDSGREEHVGKSGKRIYSMNATVIKSSGRIKRCIWRITTKPFRGAHFAVYPEQLVETPIKAGCPEQVCKKCGSARRNIIRLAKNSDAFNIRVRDVQEGRIKHFDRVASDWEVGRYDEKAYQPTRRTSVVAKGCGCRGGFKPGVVLDPFIGSGTTAIIAKKLGRNFIGFEMNPAYIRIAETRLRSANGKPNHTSGH